MNDDNTFRTVDETIRQQFESGWAAGNPQPIEALVGQPTSENYLATLEELVHIELEFRWKKRDPLKRPQLEDYLERFEPLADSAILSRLVAQEIKLRLALGETPTSAEYEQRFPEATVEIPATDQGAQDTGVKSEDDVDTQHEMPTMAPESGTDSSPGSDPLDSATLAGPEQQAKRKIILEGDFVPGYDLLGELGRGGMGVVYQARDQKLKRIVALKMILSGVHASEEDMQRFQTEAEAVAKLQHPNIVQIFEVGEHKGNPYISLEYQEGGGLDNKIAGTPQNIEESAQLIETLSRAMEVAHQEDIIHRDLKPANILLSADGEPKITDFGLAKRMDEDSNQTKSGAVMGTPSYMAPEQAASSNETIGPAADTYALGAILYHLLTGRPPFRAETQLDTLMQVISDEPLPPKRLNSKVPADLETICLKCLQKDIKRRYGSCEELAEDLRRFQAGEPIAARPVSAIERGWKWTKRRPALAGMIGVSIVAAVALVVGGLWYNAKLIDERNVADGQTQLAKIEADRANEQTKLAEEARLETRRRMAHANVINGTQLLEEGNLSGALSWFTEALRLDEGIPAREQIHRQRLALVLAACPKPKHVWIQKTHLLVRAGFTPDYQKVFTVHVNGTINLWDLKTGAPIGEPIENDGMVLDVSFDQTGNLLATAVAYEGQDEVFSITRIWDLTTRKRLKERYRQEDGTEQVAFHPHKKQLMTASSRGKVVIWDTETGTPVIETIEHPRDRPSGPIDIQRNEFSPDGSLLLTASTDHTVRLWETSTGLPISRPLVHSDQVNQAHFSPDGKRVATASNDNTARLWSVETGLPITPPLQHADDVLRVVFSADGRRVATTSKRQDARVWDAMTGKPLTGYLEHHDQVTAISFSADGQFVATGCMDGNVRLWSVGSGQLHGPLMPHPGVIQFVEFHPDGRHLLTTSRPTAQADGTEARIWDLAANQPRPMFLEGADARHAQFIPNSTHVLVADQEHGLRVHETKTGALTIEPVKTSGDIQHFEFNKQGTKLVTATAAGIARVWDTASLKPLTTPMQNHSPIHFAHFNHDGSQLVTITKDDAVRVWNTNSGTQLAEIFDGTGPYESLDAVFHPDGQLLTFRRHHERFDTSLLPVQTWTIDKEGTLTPGTLKLDTREAFSFKRLYHFNNPGEASHTLNPQGDQLLVIIHRRSLFDRDRESGFTANVFDTATASEIYEIPYDEDFSGASFSENGKLLLIYTKTRARVWDASNGQPVSPWIRTGGRIEDAIFSPNGLLVATAGQLSDSRGSTWGTACIWDARSGQPLTTRLVHDKPVTAIDFSTDSSQLLTQANSIRIWQIQPTRYSLDELTVITQFLNSARLDETATLQPLTIEEQRKSWQAVKENRSIHRIGTDQQATLRQHKLYGLATREDDLLAMRSHQDILLQAEPKSTNLLWRRSLTAASLGDLETAVTDLRKLTTLVPDDNCYYSANYAMLLLRQGDVDAFRRECQSLLKRYTDTTDAIIAERVAKTCCLEPVQFPIDDIRIQLAGRAADAGDSNPFYAWAHLAYGMASYRTGQVELALEQLKPLGDMTKPLPPNFTMPGKVLAKFFVAMSEHQLDNHEEAERALQIALKYNRARGNIQNIPGNVYDWLRCDIIESEALSLLGKRPANSP